MQATWKVLCATGVFCIGACSSGGSAGGDLDSDLARARALQSDLVSSGAGPFATAVVSDLEVPPAAQLTPARTGRASQTPSTALGPQAHEGVSAVSEADRQARESDAALAQELEQTVQHAMSEPDLDPVAVTPGSATPEAGSVMLPSPRPRPVDPAPAEGLGTNGRTSGDDRPERNRGPNIGIIIRGGPGGVDDDCAIHDRRRPNSGPGGIMIGGPLGGGSRVGGVLINDRVPVRPAPTFPGGIR